MGNDLTTVHADNEGDAAVVPLSSDTARLWRVMFARPVPATSLQPSARLPSLPSSLLSSLLSSPPLFLPLYLLLSPLLVLLVLVGAGPSVAAPTPATPVGGPQLSRNGLIVDLKPGTAVPPTVDAHAYVVADNDTGEVLAAKNPHQRLRPASTIKMLTACALLPQLNPTTTYQVVHDDAAVEGSKVGLKPGYSYQVDDLWRGLFLSSGNDAANALANVAGGLGPTLDLMRRHARSLRADDTTVANPSGLDADRQYSSAYDLALILRDGLRRADFRGYIATRTAQFPAPKGGSYQIQNQNRLLGRYTGLIGGKTGYTSEAGHTFAAAAERDGRTLIVTLLRSENRLEDDAAALLDWAFAAGNGPNPVGTLVDPAKPSASAKGTTKAPSLGDAASRDGSGGMGGISPLLIAGVTAVVLTGGFFGFRIRARRARRRRYVHRLRRMRGL